jgi:hypothetical protein
MSMPASDTSVPPVVEPERSQEATAPLPRATPIAPRQANERFPFVQVFVKRDGRLVRRVSDAG